MKFQIETALPGSRYAQRHAFVQRSQPPVAMIRQPVTSTSWWRVVLDWISSFGTTVPMPATPVIVVETSAPAPAPVIPAPLAFGATPTHYRAFSILQPRITNDERSLRAHPAIVTFRERTKAIRQVRDQQINDDACAVLDTFVALVDAFAPLWDAAGKTEDLLVYEIGEGARVELYDDILATVAKLDAELTRVLSGETRSREKFETVQRYVEVRYGDTKDNYGLTTV